MKRLLPLCLILLAGGLHAQTTSAVKVNQCPPAPALTPFATVVPTLKTYAKVADNATGLNTRCATLSTMPLTSYVSVSTNGGVTWSWATVASLGLSGAVTPPVPTSATLTWVAPTTDTTGAPLTVPLTYNVYRGASATVLTLLLKGVTGLTAVDTPPLLGTYWYAVSAVAAGVESAQTPAVSAQLTAGKVISPAPPTAVAVH